MHTWRSKKGPRWSSLPRILSGPPPPSKLKRGPSEQVRNLFPASLEAIERDRELGDRLGLEGTPFFAVNGEAFSAAVDEAFLQKLVQGR